MITLRILRWNNVFSYGEDNEINFFNDPITQLVGKNGHGKSSIALILEECLFNKNSKGIKKVDILNRNIKAKSYSIELLFSKDADDYEIKTNRGTTQTVTLLKNGENISAHTATATFKLIEDIIGFDHKTFCQLVYQSSSYSLEFLTATDTNRKKFLIDLLNLGKYTEAFEVFKTAAKEVSESVASISTKISTTQSWLDKNLKINLDVEPLLPVPPLSTEEETAKTLLEDKLKGISSTNKKISQNNTYKAQLNTIDISILGQPTPVVESEIDYHTSLGANKKTALDASTLITKMKKVGAVCPTCLQEVNKDKVQELITEQIAIAEAAEKAIAKLNTRIAEIEHARREAAKISKAKSDWESYHSMVDNTLPEDTLDAESIKEEIVRLGFIVFKAKEEVERVTELNLKRSAHNSKVAVILSQADDMKKDLIEYSKVLVETSEKLARLQILQKTFSTNGLLAYKIECLVKDLEEIANEYLSDLSSGRFQLTFKVSSGDKLNVIITDNGKDIEILALSGGERARVNTATLLAIRKIMQSLSNARVNLLILDETVDTLDGDGKEKLVEVLLKEEYLNTFLISHGFTHPLLEKIHVIKENNISRLES